MKFFDYLISSFIVSFVSKSTTVSSKQLDIERQLTGRVIQQTDAKGINFMLSHSIKETSNLIREFIRRTPVCLINHSNFNSKRYQKLLITWNDKKTKVHYNDCKTPKILHAGGYTPFVYVLEVVDIKSTLKQLTKMYHLYAMTTLSENFAKILLVLINNDHSIKLDKIYEWLITYRLIDTEIVEIKTSQRSNNSKVRFSKMLNKNRRISLNYTLHQFNPFTRIHRKVRCNNSPINDLHLFQDKLNDFFGFPFNIQKISADCTDRVELRGGIRRYYYYQGTNAFVFRCMKQMLNYTYKIYANRQCHANLLLPPPIPQDLRPLFLEYNTPYTFNCLIKRNFLSSYCMLVPIIKDEAIEYNFWTIPIHLIIFFGVVLVFNKCSFFFHFDQLTWNAPVISGMLLGIGNARKVNSHIERTFFIFTLISGFFISEDIVNGIINYMTPLKFDRDLSSFRDLNNSGIKVYIVYNPYEDNIHMKRNYLILESNVKFAPLRSHKNKNGLIVDMLKFKNTSVSVDNLKILLPDYPDKIYVANKLVVKKSEIVERYCMEGIVLLNLSPFIHRLSDFYWRFYEVGFDNFRAVKYIFKPNQVIEEDCITRFPDEFDNNDENIENDLQSWILMILMLFGHGSAILLLIHERWIAD